MRYQRYGSLGCVGVLAAALAMLPACGDSDEAGAPPSEGGVVLLDRTNQSLTVGAIKSINGTYGADCQDRSAGDPWSIAAVMGSTLAHAPVSIVNGDNCTLTLTQVVTNTGEPGAPDVTYVAAPPLPIGTAYQAMPSGLRLLGAALDTPFAFYVNIKLPAGFTGTFTGNFALDFAFSEDPRFDPEVIPVAPPVQAIGITTTGIPSPNYTITHNLGITAPGGVVDAITGDVTIAAGSVVGEGYVLVDAAVANTFEAIDAAYTSATTGGVVPAAVPTTIPGSALLALIDGDDLGTGPKVVSLIIVNIDQATSIRAYQVVTFTFTNGAG